ncbi:hypothetical protein ZWY2020_057348 [Hordeum vulgare]|nr:hypothetical protein ZWY2020_057348 [Hordeum vulgare]
MGMGVGGGEAGAAVAVGEEGKEEEEDGGKGWRAKSKLSAAVAMVGVALALSGVLVLHRSRRHNALVKAEEGIVCMCEERARMLQDQFAVSVNLVATFHYEKQRPALDQVRPSLPPTTAFHPCVPAVTTTDSFTSRHCFLGSTAASSWAPCSGSDARSLARYAPGVTRLLAGSCLLPLQSHPLP